MFRGSNPAPAGGSSAPSPANGSNAAAASEKPPSSATTTMMNFARALGMGKQTPHTAAAPPPLDLPNPQTPNNAADTNSVFYVDDSLSELARVRRYSLSQLPLQRLVYVKRIAACCRSVGLQESLSQLLPLFQKLVVDQEAVVRTAAATELANVSHFLADPNVPFVPHTQPSLAAAALSPSSSKPPSTAQTPDPTLEDEQIVDFEVNDVTNVLPASTTAHPTEPVSAAEAIAAAAAAAAASNPDAMDVDSTGPQKSPTEIETSDPMDVSSDPAPEPTPEEKEEQKLIEEEKKMREKEEEQKTAAAADSAAAAAALATSPPPAVAAAAAAPTASSAPTATSIVPSSSSPTSLSPAVAPISTSTPSVPHSPLTDPTSAVRMESYEQIKDLVIPCLQTLILDGNAEVRAAACDSLVRVADVLRGDDVGKVVLTLVLNLAHDERDEQRTTAVHLMHELAPRLGHDLCRSFVALELAAFADDSTFRVRKATAQSFGNVCEMVGEQYTVAKLLPSFVRLSKDLIWGVRSSCARSLVAVTRVVGVQTRSEIIIPMLERFAKDSSRWVRNGAYEILGPFLHALGPQLANKELVAYFANIPFMSSAIVDQEVNYHAAFNLPAVLLTIGKDRWEELLPCFNALVKDPKFPVRRTLAYSLHEIAQILGPVLTEKDLLPALDIFLRDLDEVRYGVLKNFAHILRVLTPTKRVAYLEVLWMVQKQNENWRWRLLWAKQLGAFSKLFDAEHTVTDILPFAFALCRDQVAAVRQTASKALGRLLVRFLSFARPNHVLDPFITDIVAFATSRTYMERQLYLRMVEGFVGILPQDLFENFVEKAIPLANDKTSNVRLALVHCMVALMQHAQYFQSKAAQQIVAILLEDKHKEVKSTMSEAVNKAAPTALANSLSTLALASNSSSSSTSPSSSSSSAASVTSVAPSSSSTSNSVENSVTSTSSTTSSDLTDADLNAILEPVAPASSSSSPSTSAAATSASESSSIAAEVSHSADDSASAAAADENVDVAPASVESDAIATAVASEDTPIDE